MVCINPITLKKQEQTVPCNKCFVCLQRRSNQWNFRLMEEAVHSSSLVFLTLTYEQPPITKNGFYNLDKKVYPAFMKRLRKNLDVVSEIKKQPKIKLKYYAVGEYGTLTQRPHYHAIVFNLHKNHSELIENAWNYNKKGNYIPGHIHLDVGNDNTIKYVTKYLMKGKFSNIGKGEYFDDQTGEIIQDDRIKEFSLMSKGMGLKFLTPQMKKFIKQNLESSIKIHGNHVSIPRYYKDKVFTEAEKKVISLKHEIQRMENQMTATEWENYRTVVNYKHKKAVFNQRTKI